MIRSILFSNSKKVQTISVDQFETVLRNKVGFIWVDIAAESSKTCIPILQDIFNFHPLAIDNALYETHMPKVDDWDTYLFMVFRAVRYESQGTFEIFTPELDIFFNPKFLVTYHQEPIEAVDIIWNFCQQNQRYLSKGAGYLLYHIADEIVNNNAAMIENIEERINQIEVEIFADPQSETLEHIITVKRALQKMRRSLLPQREVFNKLSRGDFDLIQEHDRVYFRNSYDHMVRLQEINEGMRDLVDGALDTHLSVINKHMNEIMKVLTIISTIFIPLSFFTGIYGMNFIYMPEIQWRWGYFTLLGFLGIIFIGMLIYFKTRKWM